jgi:hypothetical protein
MSVIRTVLTVLLAAAMASSAVRKFAGDRSPWSADLRDSLAIPPQLWLTVGVLEAAAALGLLVGFRVPALAIAAAIGVALTMIGAVVAHLRVHRTGRALAPPCFVLAFAAATALSWLAS